MRIATLQFAPKLGDVRGNIQRADELLRTGSRGNNGDDGVDGLKPDILVLSEMALTGQFPFSLMNISIPYVYAYSNNRACVVCVWRSILMTTGYNFPSLPAIKPYLEAVGQGPSGIWAKETARRVGCKVCVGYPEVVVANAEDNESETYYNSLLVVDENGEVLVNYRKAFLYYTDEKWAEEGDVRRGFAHLPFKYLADGKDGGEHNNAALATTFGICMDINPYRFEAPWTAWEFANRVLDSRSQLVIVSMAWLTYTDREQLQALGTKPELSTFNYWIQRLMPLFRRNMEHNDNTAGEKKVVVVFANRVGEEEGYDDEGKKNDSSVRYAGTSAILAFSQRPSFSSSSSSSQAPHRNDSGSESDAEDSGLDVKILCWDLMGATEEGVCFADTTSDPQMVFSLVKT